jgi:hypothetical protein
MVPFILLISHPVETHQSKPRSPLQSPSAAQMLSINTNAPLVTNISQPIFPHTLHFHNLTSHHYHHFASPYIPREISLAISQHTQSSTKSKFFSSPLSIKIRRNSQSLSLPTKNPTESTITSISTNFHQTSETSISIESASAPSCLPLRIDMKIVNPQTKNAQKRADGETHSHISSVTNYYDKLKTKNAQKRADGTALCSVTNRNDSPEPKNAQKLSEFENSHFILCSAQKYYDKTNNSSQIIVSCPALSILQFAASSALTQKPPTYNIWNQKIIDAQTPAALVENLKKRKSLHPPPAKNPQCPFLHKSCPSLSPNFLACIIAYHQSAHLRTLYPPSHQISQLDAFLEKPAN